MNDEINKPIFVVGSPRSGTSILTWCLGYHPNIFPVPESNWMGELAASLGIAYQVGAARGDYSALSAMDISPDEFFAAFGQRINELILHHRDRLETKRKTRCIELKLDRRWLEASSTATGPKRRWVDGTPEYSFHIYGLRKLFPEALFIHLVRDVTAVVRSLLNFHRVSGVHLVASEEDAYRYWLRTVKACLKAEEAYGPRVIHRLLYSSLINNPESAMRSLLDFVRESYDARCLEPLAERINSSNVPAEFTSEDPATEVTFVDEARRLSEELERTGQPDEPSPAVADELQNAFHESCLRAMSIEEQLTKVRRKKSRDIQKLAAMLDEVAANNARLQSSRLWRFVNRAAAIEAKLFPTKGFVPDRRLQKIIGNYSRWRASHPDIANLDKPIHRAESPASGDDSDTA